MTTILAVNHNGQSAMAGDGQVTMGESVMMKGGARKVRRLYGDEIVAGFAGGVADALTLEEKFEGYLDEYKGKIDKAAVELAKEWRSDKHMQDLEALLIVMNKEKLLLISGTGEVIMPDDGVLAIGSGGNYALAAARALVGSGSDLSAQEIAEKSLHIAADIDIYTNHSVITETL